MNVLTRIAGVFGLGPLKDVREAFVRINGEWVPVAGSYALLEQNRVLEQRAKSAEAAEMEMAARLIDLSQRVTELEAQREQG